LKQIMQTCRQWMLLQSEAWCWARGVRHDNLMRTWARRGEWFRMHRLGVDLSVPQGLPDWGVSAPPPPRRVPLVATQDVQSVSVADRVRG
jgi:hypothetical protein